MKEESKRWIEAAKTLARDPDAEVVCPACSDGLLEVIDVFADAALEIMERHLVCASCGARNSLRIVTSMAGKKQGAE